MILIVCGGRDHKDRGHVFERLDQLHQQSPVRLVIHGACVKVVYTTEEHQPDLPVELRGADRWADDWAIINEVSCLRMPARWRTEGNAAGPRRNERMADAAKRWSGLTRLDVGVAAFPGGAGTESMVGIAYRHGFTVLDYRGEG